MRFCVAREIPTSGEYEMDRKRSKTRHSFVRKNLSIDMTISSGDNADMDSEEEASYQIEWRLSSPQMLIRFTSSKIFFRRLMTSVN